MVALNVSNHGRPLPPYPTTYLPGSPGKLWVMEQRWSDGYALHHPDDPKVGVFVDRDFFDDLILGLTEFSSAKPNLDGFRGNRLVDPDGEAS